MAYDRTVFYDNVRPIFGGSFNDSQFEGMESLLDFIDYFEWHPVDDQREFFQWWNSYVFATAKHETAHTMQPIEEYGKGAGKDYGIRDPQTGQVYYGRGFVQLTWRENYAKSDKAILEQNLVRDPARFPGGKVNQEWHAEQALDLEVAGVNIFKGMHQGWYTSHKLWDHLTNHKKDYFDARKIVNGVDKAGTIAAIADEFEIAFVRAWKDEPIVVPPDEMVTLRITETEARALLAQLEAQL